MGFRQPFTVHTDPAKPGTVVTGEYCHDNGSDAAQRSPAGTCEWNLLNKPGNHGWPLCVGDNSTALSMFKWNYAANATTGQQYDCNASQITTDIRYAPAGQTPVEPTYDGLDTLPGPVEKATIFKKYGTTVSPAFGDLSAGGMQPITGPIYRSSSTSGAGAFPAYYDGSWLINNRGSNDGFWKEVQLRKDNNEMLRVNEWLPYNGGVNPSGANSSLVIGTQFGPDGNLYMARYQVGCCRSGTSENDQQPDREDLVQRARPVRHRHRRPERVGGRHRPGLPGHPEHLRQHRQAAAVGHGLGLRRRQEPRVPPSGYDRMVALLR